MADKNYIDPKGYWVDPDRNVRRMGNEGGEQRAILRATPECSEAEWKRICDILNEYPLKFGGNGK